jgi:hypothetical protein
MAREATDGDSPSWGDELDLVADIIRLRLRDGETTMNDDDDDAISNSMTMRRVLYCPCNGTFVVKQLHSKW